MPDGSQQPVDPAAQRAQEQMRQWREQHRQGDGGGLWGSLGRTIGDMVAARAARVLDILHRPQQVARFRGSDVGVGRFRLEDGSMNAALRETLIDSAP